MEPISLILSALATGAAQAIGQNAYQSLKELIKRKFESFGKAGAGYVLEQHEKNPEVYEAPLKAELAEVGVDHDEEIIQKAQELLKQLKPEEAAAGKFNIKVEGDIKGIVGDISGGTVNQTIS